MYKNEAFALLDYASLSLDGRFKHGYFRQEAARKLKPVESNAIDLLTFEKMQSINLKCADWCVPTDPSFYFVEEAKARLHASFQNRTIFNSESVASAIDLGPGSNRFSHPSCDWGLKLMLGISGTQKQMRWLDASCAAYSVKVPFGPKRTLCCSSSLSFVPKTSTSSRAICTEPSGSMLIQKGISSIFEEDLLHNGIDLRRQPQIQHELARLGSIDGGFATIDLSSASDSISMAFCEYFFPDHIYRFLCLARSECFEYGGVNYPLHMMSTMGNGFTFSMQTLIFYYIVRTCCSQGRVGVFGDDIIVPTRYFERVCKVLTLCGFTINPNKTFSTGSFRETCGHDYLDGQNIRPHYVKDTASIQDLCVHVNRVNKWLDSHSYRHSAYEDYVNFLIDHYSIPTVPDLDEVPDTAGIKRCRTEFGRSRYFVNADPPRLCNNSLPNGSYHWGYLFKCYVAKRFTSKFYRGTWTGRFERDLNKMYVRCPDLVLQTFLRGNIRDGACSFRVNGEVNYYLGSNFVIIQ